MEETYRRSSLTLMETYMMIKEFHTLVDYYKGKISESTLLDKAVRVAAEAQILIDDPNTPAALKEPVVKEMLKEKNMLNDKVQQGPSVAMTAPGVSQLLINDNKMDGLQERLLKELAKSINANTQSIVPQITQTPLTVKKEEPKPKKKRRQTEVERLKEFSSWEPWEKRGYDPYQAFQDDEDQYASITSQGKGKKGKGKSKKKRPLKRCPQSGGGGGRPSRKRTRQQGGGLDIQKWISKLGVEFH